MKHYKNQYVTIPQLAKLMGLSRIAIFKKVKKGEIKAIRFGRNYAIPTSGLDEIIGKVLRKEDKKEISAAVKKTVQEYGEVLKMLGRS
jgi:excisionase family DNA binding protein